MLNGSTATSIRSLILDPPFAPASPPNSAIRSDARAESRSISARSEFATSALHAAVRIAGTTADARRTLFSEGIKRLPLKVIRGFNGLRQSVGMLNWRELREFANDLENAAGIAS